MFKAVIFDLDGVLVDAGDWHYQAFNRALAIFGYTISEYDHLTVFNGLTTKGKLRYLSEQQDLPLELHPLLYQLKQKFTLDFIKACCTPDRVKIDMLKRLTRHGIRLAVCSNAIRSSVDLLLAGSGIDNFFELTLSNQDVTRAKPNPAIYHKAFRLLDLEPSDCLIVEDSEYGRLAAHASGAHVIEVDTYSEVSFKLFENLQRSYPVSSSPLQTLKDFRLEKVCST